MEIEPNIKWYYQQTCMKVIAELEKRNIRPYYCESKDEVTNKVLSLLTPGASIGIAGSMTLKEINLVDTLEKNGYNVFNQYRFGLSKEESLRLRREGTYADFYFSSVNAITLAGELVVFNAYGNRVAGIAYAKKTILIAGANKIVPTLQEAISRVRNYVTPINCKRLGMRTPCADDGLCKSDICYPPDYERNCCQILIIESEWTKDRLHLILVAESLGY